MNPKQFKKLQLTWDMKLAASGFIDIETGYDIDSGKALKKWDSFYFERRYSPVSFQEKEKYHRLASQLFEDNPFLFANETEEKIWLLHSDGVTVERILEILRAQKVKTNREYIHRTIREFKSILLTMCD